MYCGQQEDKVSQRHNPSVYSRILGGFNHIFENSPLFFQWQGKNFTKRKKEKDQQM
jgi:hypothetical protein